MSQQSMTLDSIDQTLLGLLEANARASTAALARELGLSRSTVKDRLARLEKRGVIRGYKVVLGDGSVGNRITAQVMININPKFAAQVVKGLAKLPAIRALHTINGNHDLLAIISTASTQALDQTLDQIGELEGIDRTESAIILSTKFER